MIIIVCVLMLGVRPAANAQITSSPQAPAINAVRSFYSFHLAHNKDFSLRNVQQRKRFLTPELYGLLVGEIKRQAAYTKAHPDEAPDFEGDPLTDSQEYPDSFRVGKADGSGDIVKVGVTLLWSARTSRGRDKRDIVVEMTKRGQAWLINDVVNSEGTSLREDLKKPH
jgi:hypothetical protein